jgi:oligoribonuclease
MNHDPNDLLVWLDLETTGLNPQRCSIIQMGIVITDNDLNEIEAAEWTILPPKQDRDVYWEPDARAMHEATGLLSRVSDRPYDPTGTVFGAVGAILYAEAMLNRYFPDGFRPILAGNSVHFDWRFLAYADGGAYADIARRFFHRHYDASAVMEWSRRTLGMMPRWSRPKGTERPHTALADLRETLADMRLLREDMRRTVFAPANFGPPVVEVSELAHVVNNALAPTGHAGERLAALIAECGATEHEKAEMLDWLHRVTHGIGKVDAFVREKTRQPAFVPPVKAPTPNGDAQ